MGIFGREKRGEQLSESPVTAAEKEEEIIESGRKYGRLEEDIKELEEFKRNFLLGREGIRSWMPTKVKIGWLGIEEEIYWDIWKNLEKNITKCEGEISMLTNQKENLLDQLHDRGLILNEEYEIKKKELGKNKEELGKNKEELENFKQKELGMHRREDEGEKKE
ncbi:MAG: hypothetical protein CEN88_19 [Candidatus Berkelbacteria bacterium Licking1014_2]|uniref:Uncharacterized protein n=1 Tax=Candidatus Berkelbacteria bacterium Licking1014_2 TaxID=2017146 RepID=A0A554LXB6_9BACT|nr:MAG: hypothetical protein CEN88_19 [Candidatus Berkelbacteria bacterium Licking1014_2]